MPRLHHNTVRIHHTRNQHTDNHHTRNQHTDNQHTENQHTRNQHTDNQDAGNHETGLPHRIRLLTMLLLVLIAKVGVALIMGADEVPGSLSSRFSRSFFGTSRSGDPADRSSNPMTPLGMIASRIIDRLRGSIATDSEGLDPPATEVADAASEHPAHPPR